MAHEIEVFSLMQQKNGVKDSLLGTLNGISESFNGFCVWMVAYQMRILCHQEAMLLTLTVKKSLMQPWWDTGLERKVGLWKFIRGGNPGKQLMLMLWLPCGCCSCFFGSCKLLCIWACNGWVDWHSYAPEVWSIDIFCGYWPTTN